MFQDEGKKIEYPEDDEKGTITVDIDNTLDKHDVINKVKLSAADYFRGCGNEEAAKHLMS